MAEHTLHTLKHVKRDKYLRLTMLFHDMGKPAMKTTDEKGNDHFKGHALESEKIARTVLKRLKFDNETIRIVTKLVCYHDYRMEANTGECTSCNESDRCRIIPILSRSASCRCKITEHLHEKGKD